MGRSLHFLALDWLLLLIAAQSCLCMTLVIRYSGRVYLVERTCNPFREQGVEMNQHEGGAAKDFMHRYLEVVPQDTTAEAAAERMGVKQIGCLLVESNDPKRGMS